MDGGCEGWRWQTYNDLLIGGDELQGLLDDPAAVHLQGQRQNVSSDPLRQGQLLVQAAKLKHKEEPVNRLVHHWGGGTLNCLTTAMHLEELLDDVVAEHVHHQLVRRLQDLAEDELALRGAGSLQLQLDEPLTEMPQTH